MTSVLLLYTKKCGAKFTLLYIDPVINHFSTDKFNIRTRKVRDGKCFVCVKKYFAHDKKNGPSLTKENIHRSETVSRAKCIISYCYINFIGGFNINIQNCLI